MPVIAVVNRKGGSGKSTLATHLAAWLARQGAAVMLGDVDRQQSARTWIKRRDPALPAIAPWAMDQNVLKVPAGVTHVVLDTPGGIRGLELSKIVMASHAILMPVCNSLFDRESAGACITELMQMPRFASGRCKLGVIGMRVDARTHAAQTLREWAQTLHVPFVGVLRETQLYVRSLENGLTVFDLAGSANKADLVQWESILQWLQPITQLGPVAPAAVPAHDEPASAPANPARSEEHIYSSRAPSLMPAQESLVHGSRLSVFSQGRGAMDSNTSELPMMRHARELPHAEVPRFLLHR